MQLVPDGPDLPKEVLEAHEQDSLVLFCGAGVSMDAGLPSFRGLVDAVYRGLGGELDDLEKTAYEDALYDRVLGLLERRLGTAALHVRQAVRRILTPAQSTPRPTHRALLELATAKNGALRLVTTNFDRLFEEAAAQDPRVGLRCFSAPLLPVPKPHKWNGLVYLHGRIRDDDPDGHDLVYTSADFGAAYLTERWASRFVTELFRQFTVLFVGYALKDPVMRYVTDALEADRVHERDRAGGRTVKGAFALTEHKDVPEWSASGVRPLFYPEGAHDVLHDTLREWSRLRAEGRHSRPNRLKQHLPHDPGSLTPEERSQVRWALDDRNAAGTLRAAKTHPRWLPFLYASDWKIAGDVVAGAFHVRDETAPRLGPGHCEFLEWIIATQLATREAIEWALSHGTRLHPTFRRRLRETLPRSELPSALQRFWWLVAGDEAPHEGPHALDVHSVATRLDDGAWDASLRLLVLASLSPRLTLTPAPPVLRGSDPATWPVSATALDQIAWVDVDLVSDDQTPTLVRALLEHRERNRVLLELADPVTSLLARALDLWAAVGRASETEDLSFLHLPSVDEHVQNRRLHEWVFLMDLCREAFEVAAAHAPDLARSLLGRWVTLRYPAFMRLAMNALSKSDLWPVRTKIRFLTTGRLDA